MRRMIPILALILLTFPAAAADKAGPPAPAAVVAAAAELRPPFHGLHIGAVLGHSAGTIRTDDGFSLPRDGYSIGGLIGYDHRLSLPGVPGIVLGGEADLAVTDVSGSTGVDGFTVRGSSKILASLRARLGYSFGNSMLYATGGVATTNGKITATDGSIAAEASQNHIKGLVYGAGLESYLLGNLGLRFEVLRYDWRKSGFASDSLDTGKLRLEDTQVRAGFIFRL